MEMVAEAEPEGLDRMAPDQIQMVTGAMAEFLPLLLFQDPQLHTLVGVVEVDILASTRAD